MRTSQWLKSALVNFNSIAQSIRIALENGFYQIFPHARSDAFGDLRTITHAKPSKSCESENLLSVEVTTSAGKPIDLEPYNICSALGVYK